MKTRDPIWRLLGQSANLVPSQKARSGIKRYALKKKIANSNARMGSIEKQGKKMEASMAHARDATKKALLTQKQAEKILTITQDYVQNRVQRRQERQYQLNLHPDIERLFPELTRETDSSSKKTNSTRSTTPSSKKMSQSFILDSRAASVPTMPLDIEMISNSVQTSLQRQVSKKITVFESMRSGPILSSSYLMSHRSLIQSLSDRFNLSIITSKYYEGRIFLTGEFTPKNAVPQQNLAGICLLELSKDQMVIINPKRSISSALKRVAKMEGSQDKISKSSKQKTLDLFSQLQSISIQRDAREVNSSAPSEQTFHGPGGRLVEHMPEFFRIFRTVDRIPYVADTRLDISSTQRLSSSHVLMKMNIDLYIKAVRKFTSRGLSNSALPSLYAASDLYNVNICVWTKAQEKGEAKLALSITPKISLNEINQKYDPKTPKLSRRSEPEQTIHLLHRIDSKGRQQYQAILSPESFYEDNGQQRIRLPSDQFHTGFSGHGGESLYLSILNAMPQTHAILVQHKQESNALSMSLSKYLQKSGTILDKIHQDVAKQLQRSEYTQLISREIKRSVRSTQR